MENNYVTRGRLKILFYNRHKLETLVNSLTAFRGIWYENDVCYTQYLQQLKHESLPALDNATGLHLIFPSSE